MGALLSSPPPVLYVTTITEASIEAARLEFLRRAREAAASDDSTDFEDVVVTEHLSREQFDQVPRDWLRGVQVFLRGDGMLVMTNVENAQYKRASLDLSCQVANSSGIGSGSGLDSRSARSTARPLVLSSEDVTLALFQVEVYHRTIQRVIRTAAYYLQQLPTVQRVVFIKFFPPQQPGLDENHQVRVPALAVVFCRSQNGRIRVEQMRSFGNAPIPLSVVNAFVQPDTDLLLEPFPDALYHADSSAELTEPVNADDPLDGLFELRKHKHEFFQVHVAAPHPSMPLDLVRLFAWVARRPASAAVALSAQRYMEN